MKAKRAALLGMLACLISAAASAQLATNNQGDIGLFTMPTADQPQPGHFTLGAYGWFEQLAAADLPYTTTDVRTRVFRHVAGEFSLGFGINKYWSVFASGGAEDFRSRGGWEGGVINGVPITAPFDSSEARKVRIGTKVTLYSEADPDFKVGLWLAGWAPVSNSTPRQDQQFTPSSNINTDTTDWEWGVAVTKGWFTGMASYILAGHTDDLNYRPPNKLRFGLGVDVPVGPIHVITELDRTIVDGGDYPEPNYSMLNAGARFWIGQTGIAVSTALNMNLDLLVKHGNNPSPFGAVIGMSYAAWPPPPPAPVAVPPPAPSAPVVEEQKAAPAPAPAPAAAPAPPPPPTPKRTTDEIFFDAGSARLTNIAKAMLDGIALRMKNDLNATAAITGYTDNSGKSEDAN
ncbi:MAG TPA: hypothetical protein VEG84_11410, partial [Thermoanaerobaculia bacterium]|nr:hypothetical protein [Thermoanaerobaculia bacterium]